MDQDAFDDLLRRLTVLVVHLDQSHSETQEHFRRQDAINERLTAAIERLDTTQARIETLLARMIRQDANGTDA